MKSFSVLFILGVAIAPGIASAFDETVIRANEVIPIRIDSAINAKSARVGDRFRATVDGYRELPAGTRLLGVIRDIQKQEGNRKAFAELEFVEIEYPNGEHENIDAVPTPLGDRYVSRDRTGRMEGKKATRRDHVVIGGTVGGLILGSLIKKPFEGAMIGALAGILVAETDGFNTSGQLIVDKNQKLGALFSRETRLVWDDDGSERRDRVEPPIDRTGDIQIQIDSKTLVFERGEQPYRDGATIMVTITEMADQMSLNIERGSDGIFYLENDDNSLRLERDSTNCRANGKRVNLPKPTTMKDGVLYVPLEAFEAIRPGAFRVNGTKFEKDSLV